jgi:hypothetical protein
MSLIAESTFRAQHPGMTLKHPDGKKSPSALRAKALVKAMDFRRSSDFARWMEIDPRRWNNFEVGYPFSRDMAQRLMAKIPGLSFDWILDGNPNGLSIEMARKLGELPEPVILSPKSGERAKGKAS